MYRICKSFKFEAAHQLDRAFSKVCCESIHGHSYTVEVFLTSTCLNGDLMVVDFGVLKEAITDIRDEWDHSLMLSAKLARDYISIPSKKTVVFEASPTAEVMATTIHNKLQVALAPILSGAGNALCLEKVRVHETATGWAEFVKEK